MKKFVMPLWLKLFLFAGLMLIPTVFVLVHSLSNSLSFIADLSINSEIETALHDNIANIQRIKELVPQEQLGSLEENFNRNLTVLQAYSELKNLKRNLIGELQFHAAVVGGIALLISLLCALGLARSIVKMFRRYTKILMEKEHQQALVSGLENWQTVSQSVIHELKSSLTPLKLVSSLRKDALKTDISSEMTTIIAHEVKKMEVLIDDLTGFARLPRPEFSSQDVIPTLDYLVKYSVIDDLAVHLNLGGLEKHNPSVPHDPAMIQRTLYNLMRNSKEANSDQADLQITISTKLRSRFLEVHFCDNGRGIPIHKLTAIFAPRHSEKPLSAKTSTLQRLPTNLGLGLTISKKIALDHGGDLFAIPSETGAHFILKLPLVNTETPNKEFDYV